MSTRREFLLNCAALAATAALAPATALATGPRLRDVSLENISAGVLAQQLNTYFIARDNPGGAVALQLAAVQPSETGHGETVSAAAAGEPYESFSLFFVGDV